MKKKEEKSHILHPRSQLNLFGYEDYFSFFINLYKKNKVPKILLFNGPKGLGKSTFVYHLVNYFLSQNEERPYDLENFTIDSENKSYKLLCSNTHPNGIFIENVANEKNIKISQIRNLLSFINKSAYSKAIKIVIIDNFENLNLNSTNALLKSIEEPPSNTFFFIIHNSSNRIPETIRSRCTEFRIFLANKKKELIFNKLLSLYGYTKQKILDDNFYFDTPGISIKYYSALVGKKFTSENILLEIVLFFIKRYKENKNQDDFFLLPFFIEKYFYKLCLTNFENSNVYFHNYIKILKLLHDMKNYNLDEKNVLFWVNDILINEKK